MGIKTFQRYQQTVKTSKKIATTITIIATKRMDKVFPAFLNTEPSSTLRASPQYWKSNVFVRL